MATNNEAERPVDPIGEQEQPTTKDTPSADSDTKRKAEWKEIDDEKNTNVYVTGLPTTITEDEFISLMEKYGVIAKKPIHGEPKNIKLYKNKDGTLKGDGLCKYQRKESVSLAIDLLDGYQYDHEHVIHCEKAKFEPKASYDPSKRPRLDPNIALKQRKRLKKVYSWEPEDRPEHRQKKVVLKNMFTVDEITDDPSLILTLRTELEQRCVRELEVEPKRVDVYDANPDGVITITFAEPEQAQRCVHAFSTNYPCLDVELWDGKTKFKVKETDEQVEKRIEKFHKDIEGPEGGDGCDDSKPELDGETTHSSPSSLPPIPTPNESAET
uniref:HIV Tat-specific factor 1 n=1 Tax=Aceria tosichella TaxID=561515 RepID=A0A6G1SDE7_9ACAR